jgi:hypothetical protein
VRRRKMNMRMGKRVKSVIIITLLGCLICIVSAFVIAWLGESFAKPEYVLANETKDETEAVPEETTEMEVKSTGAILPQWLFYQSVGSDALGDEKTYLDVLINRWTKGELSDDELSGQLTDYLEKKGISISTMGVQSEALCVFPSAKELPDYTRMLEESNENGLYDFIGVYTNGEYDKEGRLICFYWEAGVMGA